MIQNVLQKRMVLVLAILALIIGNTRSGQAFDGVSDLLGEVFRRLVPRPQPAAVPVQPLRQMPPPPPAELKARHVRLEAYFAARLYWLKSICDLDEEQVPGVVMALEKLRAAAEQEYAQDNHRRSHGFSDYAAVRFTVDGAASRDANSVDPPEMILEQLTNRQRDQLKRAQQARAAAMQAVLRDRIVDVFDSELFLTSNQREQLERHIAEKLGGEPFRLYSLTPQNFYLNYTSPEKLLSGLDLQVLSAVQRKRCAAVCNSRTSGSGSERYLTFMSNQGVDGWYDSLDEAMHMQRDRLLEIAAVRSEFYQAEFGLNDEQVRRLELAAKGTVLYCLEDWEESTVRNLRQWEERMQEQQQFRNGNFGFSVSVPQTQVVDQHQLWKSTLSDLKIDLNDSESDRALRQRRTEAAYLLALLDQELWLTPEQRMQMAPLLSQVMPRSRLQGYDYFYEVYLMAIPVMKLNDKDLEKILAPSQRRAWENLKGQYRVNGQNVTITGRNMGNFTIHIPD